MMNDLDILVYQNREWVEGLKGHAKNIVFAEDLQQVVQNFVEQNIDLVIYKEGSIPSEKLGKIFTSYHIPFISVDNGEVLKCIEKKVKEIHSFRIERENEDLLYFLSVTRDFNSSVKHVAKDFFIAEAKQFLKKIFLQNKTIGSTYPMGYKNYHPSSKLRNNCRIKK